MARDLLEDLQGPRGTPRRLLDLDDAEGIDEPEDRTLDQECERFAAELLCQRLPEVRFTDVLEDL